MASTSETGTARGPTAEAPPTLYVAVWRAGLACFAVACLAGFYQSVAVEGSPPSIELGSQRPIQSMIDAGDFDAAIAALRVEAMLQPETTYLNSLYQLSKKVGDEDSELLALRKLAFDPLVPGPRVRLAARMVELERVAGELRPETVAEASVLLERALEVDPRSVRALETLGRLRADAGDRDGAIEALRRAIALEPDNLALRERLARVEHPERRPKATR